MLVVVAVVVDRLAGKVVQREVSSWRELLVPRGSVPTTAVETRVEALVVVHVSKGAVVVLVVHIPLKDAVAVAVEQR